MIIFVTPSLGDRSLLQDSDNEVDKNNLSSIKFIGLGLNATPAFLQSSNQYHSQFAVTTLVRCHALCEMGLLFLIHLRVETVCVSLSDAPRQTQGSPIFVQLLEVSEQEYYSWSTE